MNPETFFDKFGLLADTPNGVQKLRELILQLAVQGKLVQQDENDESAAVLLEKIKAEKERLVKEKKIRKSKTLPPVEIDEIRFEIPESWEWRRFGDVLYNRDGERIPVSKEERNTRERIYDYYGASGIIDKIDNYLFDKPLLLIGEDGANLINRSTPIAFIAKGKYWVNNHAHVLDGISLDFLRYIEIFVNATDLTPYVTGTAQPKMNQAKMNSIPVSLPPLSEQHRIVAKVDQLMALCDELEARQQKKQEARLRLNSAALDKLLTAHEPAEFANHWQRVCDNFDLLYDNPETVGELRKAILQLAVQGKLVRQDENDEPAAVLLEKIRVEKERLVKEGKIRKSKAQPNIKLDEVPFELPVGWIWARLGDTLLKLTDGTHHSPPNSTSGAFKYITAKNIKPQGVNLTNVTYVSAEIHKEIYSRCNPEFDDILYIKDGATTGIVVINNLEEPFSMLSSVALMKPSSETDNRYLLHVLRSPFFYSLMRDDMSGVAITRVTLTKLNRAMVPIAPYCEQRRIVAKVDQLMALCDELEAKLDQSQTDGAKLMEAVVAGLAGAQEGTLKFHIS